MTKEVLKKVQALKSENGILTGGFYTLSTDQKRKLKGGIKDKGSNLNCVCDPSGANTFQCGGGNGQICKQF
ncbi:MAG: hypothetical protein LBE36_08145 [Flavobacteriaceae bacterium]|jgi:hypothetical protein|nr:hypothetical protein [Flavobacteriaceae bacterium]